MISIIDLHGSVPLQKIRWRDRVRCRWFGHQWVLVAASRQYELETITSKNLPRGAGGSWKKDRCERCPATRTRTWRRP